jgi:hypothetical protein
VIEGRQSRPICGMAFEIAVADFPPPDRQSTPQAVTSERLATRSRHGRNNGPSSLPTVPSPQSTSELSHAGGHTTLPTMIGRNDFSANWHGRPRCRQLVPFSCPSQDFVRNPCALCVSPHGRASSRAAKARPGSNWLSCRNRANDALICLALLPCQAPNPRNLIPDARR